LAEVLAATSIGAFVALVAIGALRSTSSGASMVQDRSDRAVDLRFAARRVALDLENIVRGTDPNYFRFITGLESSGYGDQAYLTFWTVSHEKVRVDQPEGDVYEVEYYVAQKDDRTVLMRRVWPHPDPNVDPGGVLTVLSDQVAMMKVSCFDGEKWVSDWLETAQELPQLIEVSLVGTAPEGGVPSVESILVIVNTTAELQIQADLEAAQQGSTSEAANSQTQGTTSSSTTGGSGGG
jgi:type II secretory pathway component PulJ